MADDQPVLAEPVRFEQSPPSSETRFVGVAEPRLSWRIESAPSGWRQQVAEVELHRENGTIDSVSIPGPDQVFVPWPFAPLAALERGIVRVRVGDGAKWSDWGPPASVESSLLSPADWSAQWISPVDGADVSDPAPVIGTTFTADAGLRLARLHVTALGIVQPSINGSPVSPDLFTPGWTSYDKLVRFRSYDVTSLVTEGSNELSALVGNGWFRGRIASQAIHRGEPYGSRLALRAQLHLEYEDGRTSIIASDAGWKTTPSRVLSNDFYDGQSSDLRLPEHPEFDRPVEVIEPQIGSLELATMPPVRRLRTVPPASTSVVDGTTMVDFGTNLVGWLRIRTRGAAGTTVTIRHAEVLEEGQLSLRPLRSARVTDRFVLAGGSEVLEPSLTYHGFRYAVISGLEPASIEAIDAVVIGSTLTRTGWFESSDREIDLLHRNVVNSTVGNFVDIPTDCPQRDERLGWTADIQVFAPTASVLFDVGDFLDSWLESLRLDQHPDGRVPPVVPSVLADPRTIAGWGDAAVVVPWVSYQRYADIRMLRRQYPSMVAWVERERSQAGATLIWRGGHQNGDWLDPLAPPEDPGNAQADPDVVATACFFHSIDLLAKAASELGFTEDVAHYSRLRDEVAAAFEAAFVSPDGRITSHCQTVYATALEWQLLRTDALREAAGHHLVEIVERQDFTVATGFIGTPVILHALTRVGRADVAYRMLTSHAFPGWLYAVDLGASTMWERWDSLLADGSVNPGSMTSFNHYAFGSVASWMHETLAGFVPQSPGGREIRLQPMPLGTLTGSSFRYDSPYGELSSAWRTEGGEFTLEVSIPVGVTATVILPEGRAEVVEHGCHRFIQTSPSLSPSPQNR